MFSKYFYDGDFIILLFYFDNLLIVGQDTSKIDNLKKELSNSFTMKKLGPTKQILGVKISHDRNIRKLWLSQESTLKRCFKDLIWIRQSQSTLHLVLTSSYVLSKVLQVEKRNRK